MSDEDIRAEGQARIVQRRIEIARANSGLPERFKGCSINEYQTDGNPGRERAVKVCRAYVNRFSECLDTGRCLLLIGTTGTGKTHLAAAIINVLTGRGVRARYVEAYTMVESIKYAAFDQGRGEAPARAQYVKPALLVIDDVGSVTMSDWERSAQYKVINDRYTQRKPTLLTSNLTPDSLRAHLSERAWDRLHENGGTSVLFDWESYRRAAT